MCEFARVPDHQSVADKRDSVRQTAFLRIIARSIDGLQHQPSSLARTTGRLHLHVLDVVRVSSRVRLE